MTFKSTFKRVALALGLLSASACGEESHVDEFGGVMDLYPFADPKPTPTTPNAGIPTRLAPSLGFSKNETIEFYDLGTVPSERTGSNPTLAPVNPMYFLFDQSGNPLLAAPVKSERTGAWILPGGNPTESPNAESQADKTLPHSLRTRRQILDRTRNSTAHQRPIVDVAWESRSTTYTGLWEIVEVVATGGYTPDDIKSWTTLEKAIEAGKFRMRRTERVINCPLQDERTDLVASLTSRGTPQPMMEVWYRRKLGFCFLVNGWETLAKDGELIPANQDEARLNTFDTQTVELMVGAEKQTAMRVPVGKAYTPLVTVNLPAGGTAESRYNENQIIEERPRRTPADPPGYSPIRWLHDFTPPAPPVDPMAPPAEPKPYVSGTIKTIDGLPAAALKARSGPLVRNLASLGAVPSCGPKDATTNACTGDAGACTAIGLECNPSTCLCDLPAVGWGEVCGPGFQRCRTTPTEEEKAFAPMGFLCHPRDGRGFCQPRCDATGMNMSMQPGTDSRCAGLPGFSCVTPGDASNKLDDKKQSLCVRTCKTSEPASCKAAPQGVPEVPSEQVCVSQRQVTACMFNDALYPF